MLIYNAKGQLFLGERYGKPGHWQFPQGGVEAGETLRENVLRELREEVGVSRKQIKSIRRLKARNSYLWKKVPAYARGKWIGQSQTFWLVEFVGADTDIDLKASDDQEFQDWKWCSVATVRRIAARERVAGYSDALKEFLQLKKVNRQQKSGKTHTTPRRQAPCRKR
jgi:putative (di)nucleoside polyphosphate hydrolase